MLLKTIHVARTQPGRLRRLLCEVRGHGTPVPIWGPHTEGYGRCSRCDQVVGPAE